MTTADALARLYNWLLYLYPHAFYRRFAPEMRTDFRDGYAAARCGGVRSLALFFVRTGTDIAVSLVSQWRNSESLAMWGTSVVVAISIWSGALVVAALEWPRGPATTWFVMQLAIALTAGASFTIGLVVRRHNPS